MCTLKGFNTKNKKGITYRNLSSAIRPVPHGSDIPVPNPPKQLHTLDAESSATPNELADYSEYGTDTHGTHEPFTQTELNDLARDLNLPKDAAELLGPDLGVGGQLTPGTYVTFYRNQDKDLLQYFTQEESLVYCNDIPNLVNMLDVEYKTDEWRLFIDSSKRSLKGVLLHNGNSLASVPVAHSVHLKETYENL
jgi:hypothetical protein